TARPEEGDLGLAAGVAELLVARVRPPARMDREDAAPLSAGDELGEVDLTRGVEFGHEDLVAGLDVDPFFGLGEDERDGLAIEAPQAARDRGGRGSALRDQDPFEHGRRIAARRLAACDSSPSCPSTSPP